MPQIIIQTSGPGDGRGTTVHRERINPTDVATDRSSGLLIERISWALQDAESLERDRDSGYDDEPADSFEHRSGTIADAALL